MSCVRNTYRDTRTVKRCRVWGTVAYYSSAIANRVQPALPADADTRAFYRVVLGVVIVTVGRRALSAADAERWTAHAIV